MAVFVDSLRVIPSKKFPLRTEVGMEGGVFLAEQHRVRLVLGEADGLSRDLPVSEVDGHGGGGCNGWRLGMMIVPKLDTLWNGC